MNLTNLDIRPAGYQYIVEQLKINAIPNWHRSYVSKGNHTEKLMEGKYITEIFRSQYWPGDGVFEHLEFALKYDGVNPQFLYLIFQCIESGDLVAYIQSKPTGKYARILWFLYEYLLGVELPLEDIKIGNYVAVLNEKKYYTLAKGFKSKRHRVVDNFLGVRHFCPVVRKTEVLSNLKHTMVYQRCLDIQRQYSSEHLRRALGYLYTKETKSSFEIEREQPSPSRIERFVALLELASKEDFCTKERLLELQNHIVDSRFTDSDYRNTQNYVGETLDYRRERIHFISPKPTDIHSLMEGLLQTHQRMKKAEVSAIIHATVISYGFVFFHPFEDGNGRIHRFLLHNIFALRELVPAGLMFPISATMLKNPSLYDLSLESFSRPLMQCLDYELNELGEMRVEQQSTHFYKYLDLTTQAEVLSDFVLKTIEKELLEELDFLKRYDQAKQALREIVDLPNKNLNLFIKICLNNQGVLSNRKRESFFSILHDSEILKMEMVIKKVFTL